MRFLPSFPIVTRRQLCITLLSVLFFVFYFYCINTPKAEASIADATGDLFGGIIYGMALGIGGMFTGIGGLLLDYTIQETVLNAGEWFSPKAGIGSAVETLWVVIRDILNILFIFSLIYIGLKTILNSEDSETRRSLGMLIIAALLINFSLFFTQVIVDFSNIAAVQIHNQIKTGLAGGYSDDSLQLQAGSIAGGFLNVVNLTSLFGMDTNLLSEMDFGKQITYSLMMMVFLIIAGIVFAMGAFLFIRRFITLTLCMIFSPIMFAGWIFPKFMGKQDEWRKKLLENAFFAPAFLFMIYLSLHVLDALKKQIFGGTDGFSKLMEGGQMTIGHFSIVLLFCLAIGFLYASIKVGEMMSIAGASSAMKITQKAIGGATAGLAGRAGRNTIGWKAQKISKNENLLEAASKGGLGGLMARGALKSTRTVADSSFDARSQGFGGGVMGEAVKGGYKTRLKESAEREMKFAESLGEDKERTKEVKDKAEATLVAPAKTELKASQDALATATLGEKNQIKALREEIKNPATSDERKKEIATEISALATAINIEEQGAKPELERLQAQVKAAEEEVKKRVAESKFSRQMAYGNAIEYSTALSKLLFGEIVHQADENAKAIKHEYDAESKKYKKETGDPTQNLLTELSEKVDKLAPSEKKPSAAGSGGSGGAPAGGDSDHH